LRGPIGSAVTHYIGESDARNGRRLLQAWGECWKWPRPIGGNLRHLLGVSKKSFRNNIVVRVKKFTFVGDVSQGMPMFQKRFEIYITAEL
jgi:hypothetical protein